MIRIGLLPAVALSLVGLGSGLARAGATPVCSRPAVLDQLTTMLRQAGRPMVLSPPIGERSTGTDRVVHCAARGQVVGYDTDQHGMQPIDATFVVRYTLELRQNGIFLRLD